MFIKDVNIYNFEILITRKRTQWAFMYLTKITILHFVRRHKNIYLYYFMWKLKTQHARLTICPVDTYALLIQFYSPFWTKNQIIFWLYSFNWPITSSVAAARIILCWFLLSGETWHSKLLYLKIHWIRRVFGFSGRAAGSMKNTILCWGVSGVYPMLASNCLQL